MTIEQTVAIPADRRIFFDLPSTAVADNAAKVTIEFPVQREDNTLEDAEITVNPPDFREFSVLCDVGKQFDYPGIYNAEELLEEAARRTSGAQAMEYRRMARRIRYYSAHRELWPDSVRQVREMRDDWDGTGSLDTAVHD
jgi:hypothetical protein